MGLTPEFLIKHVRPSDMLAWKIICQDTRPHSLRNWLIANQVTQSEIDNAFNDWGGLALHDINDEQNEYLFKRAAQDISQTRWNEYYQTSGSTILFLNESLLAELSQAAENHAGQDFDFIPPGDVIPLAVTLYRDRPNDPAVVRSAKGARLRADAQGNCCHFYSLIQWHIQGGALMPSVSSEATRRIKNSAELAEQIFERAGEQVTAARVYSFFGMHPPALPGVGGLALQAAAAPGKDDLNSLLNGVGTAPGATSVVTVPSQPATGDVALIQNVQTLDSYIAVLTAIYMYNNHPAPYDLSNKQQAAQFVIDLANARNFIVSGGAVKAIPMYLPMGQAKSESLNKTTTAANLHVDLLQALFGALALPAAELTELDAILTEIAASLKNLELSFTTQTQTLNHILSFYHLTPVGGTNPPINQMDVEFIYIQLAQSSWRAAVSDKASVSNFTLDMTITRTTATMSAGIVAANTANIVSSLISLTSNDAHAIAEMTKMKGVKT